MPLKMVTAIGKGKDSAELGTRLAREAKSGLKGKRLAFALLLASSHYDHKALLKAIRKVLGKTPLIGCTTAGEFTEKQVAKESVALTLMSASPNYAFHVSMAMGLHEDAEKTVKKAVKLLPKRPPRFPYRSAILLADGLAGRGEEAVVSAMTVLGAPVSFAGGTAGDDLAFKQTFVFCNDKITSNSVAICVIDSKQPLAFGVKHGHAPVSPTLMVTKAQENVLYEVDNQPAWEVWKREMAAEAKNLGIDVNCLQEASEVGQFLLRYEMGLTTGTEYKVRVPLSKNPDGSLNFACTIPDGAKFRIMKSPKEDQIASAEQAAKYAMEQVGKRKLAGALVFDCVCRGIILGEEFHKGVKAVQRVVGKIPLVGFETYGEICRQTGQFSGFHNTTTVVMLLPA